MSLKKKLYKGIGVAIIDRDTGERRVPSTAISKVR